MTKLTTSEPTIWSKIASFFKSIFRRERKKCASGCKCKGSCCCESCILTMAYDEKGSESDDSKEDIYMTTDEIIIK